jgi:hypothetical protein
MDNVIDCNNPAHPSSDAMRKLGARMKATSDARLDTATRVVQMMRNQAGLFAALRLAEGTLNTLASDPRTPYALLVKDTLAAVKLARKVAGS